MSHARPGGGDWIGCRAGHLGQEGASAPLYSVWREGDPLEHITVVPSSPEIVEGELRRRADAAGVQAWWQTKEDGYVRITTTRQRGR